MAKVSLAVYDLSRGMAAAMSQQILGQRIDGIWHSGIVVYGVEYYFGGGIQCSPAGQFSVQNSLPNQMLEMGQTTKTKSELEYFLRSVSHLYSMTTYDLINNNCNNFADAVCKFLTGHGIPTHIVDLPRIVFSTPGGQMLRPMIESMQQNIRQQNSTGLDPFGNAASTFSSGSSFESQLSDGVRAAVMTQLKETPPPLPCLEHRPFVSNDVGNVELMSTKLLKLQNSDDTACPILSESETAIVANIVTILTSASDSVAVLNPAAFDLLEQLIKTQAKSQLSCLFLLRLMVLREGIDLSSTTALQTIIAMVTSPHEALKSVPAKVMAVCTLANAISHDAGRRLLLGSNLGEMIDIAVQGLSDARSELRQMGAALAYNIALSFTQDVSSDDKVTGWTLGASVDVKTGDDGGSHEDVQTIDEDAMQILIAVLQEIDGDSDPIVRKRRLMTACRVIRALGRPAVELCVDLGFNQMLTDSEFQQRLTAEETSIVTELVFKLNVSI